MGASVSSAAAGPGVVLQFGSGARPVSGDELTSWKEPAQLYSLDPQTTIRFAGVSIANLIRRADYNPQVVDHVLVRGRVQTTKLTNEQLNDPGSLFIGGAPPIVFDDSPATHYVQAPSNTGDAAVNFTTASDQPLELIVFAGPPLAVSATADPTDPKATGTVTFSASVSAANATVTWTFGDGTTQQGRTVTHAYAQRGTYEALAVARTADDAGGASDPVQISVGDPPTKPGSDSGTGTKTDGLPLGPSKGNGNGNGNGDGSGSGNGEGTSKDSSASAGSSNGKSSSLPRDKAAPSPASTPAPSAAPPSSTSPPLSPPPATAVPPPSTPPASSPGASRRRPTRQRRGSRAPATPPLVRGVLVDAPIPAAAALAPSQSDAARQAAARAGRLPHPLPVGVSAVAVLMGLGAWREVVRRRRRLALLG